VEVAVTGVTAGTQDFNAQMRNRLPYVFAFVLGLAFLLMLTTFRSLTIALTAVALNLVSVGAAYGILVAVFQHGWLADAFNFQTNGAVVSWLPLFLFVVLFGLSMDYHVFILSRMKELHDAGVPTSEAIRLAITRTAGTVTSAAVIMVAVFGPLVAFGAGGVFAELIGAAQFRLAPLTDLDAQELVRDGKAGVLVRGYRGAPPADETALVDLLLRLSLLAADHPELAELDLNPVLALPDGAVAVDARVKVARPESASRTKSW
jgi:hypothetical protein